MSAGYYPESFQPIYLRELSIKIPRAAYEAAVLATQSAIFNGEEPPLVDVTERLVFQGEAVLPQMNDLEVKAGDTIGVHPGCRETDFPTLVGYFSRNEIDHEVGTEMPVVAETYPRTVVIAHKTPSLSGLFGKPKVQLEVWGTPYEEPSKSKLPTPKG